ncbi:MAG: molybdate ABC transporter substrate-binding protein [Acidimicrobiia bacterium]|nr:molybdate ABC transporter substrate-binding protein [bacterium]MXX64281.1 molybdate ABC transporter substrate-binding protein [Acidimicrobiia bacterium]MCY3579113.1 molybdate ABC transporter substrate-binding protein [bacterium]MCY3653187.1 molybdate ABC transporter substrate-binding protein [bacterium]MDE0642653.1 molybdate ABC transporter substrate-binding protein [bacterium]
MTARLTAGFAAIILLTVSCTGPDSSPPDRVELLVAAASSLTDAFGAIETAFETEHPEIDVVLNLGGSSLLREQIRAGAPVDIFASAHPEIMDTLVESGLVEGAGPIFARNALALVVPEGNPAGVIGLGDLARSELLVGICAETAPCGRYSRQVLQPAGVTVQPDTEAPNVRALVTRLEQGELDLGLVYATDVLARDGLWSIAIPPEYNVIAEYTISIVSNSSLPEQAAVFVSYVLSDSGRAILDQYGFLPPLGEDASRP